MCNRYGLRQLEQPVCAAAALDGHISHPPSQHLARQGQTPASWRVRTWSVFGNKIKTGLNPPPHTDKHTHSLSWFKKTHWSSPIRNRKYSQEKKGWCQRWCKWAKIREAGGWVGLIFPHLTAGALRDKLCIILGNMFVTRAECYSHRPSAPTCWTETHTCSFISDTSVRVNSK